MFGILTDLVRVAVAPVRLVAAVAEPVAEAVREVTRPLAEAADDVVKNIKSK